MAKRKLSKKSKKLKGGEEPFVFSFEINKEYDCIKSEIIKNIDNFKNLAILEYLDNDISETSFIGNTGITVLEPVFAKMKLIDLPGKTFVNV